MENKPNNPPAFPRKDTCKGCGLIFERKTQKVSKCRPCERLRNNKSYAENEAWRKRVTANTKTDKAKKRLKEYHAKLRSHDEIYKEKKHARLEVQKALMRGDMVKYPCAICGSVNVEAHHPDYKSPLFVIWLCRKDHRILHRKESSQALLAERTKHI